MINIAFFNIVEILGEIISSNVEDIKKDRKDNKKKWIYPTFAEKDSNLPQITIQLGDPAYTPTGSGNGYWDSETLDNGDQQDTFTKELKVTAHIYVSTAKKNVYEVVKNNEKFTLENQPLNLYLTNEVKNCLFSKRDEFLSSSAHIDDIEITSIGLPFESNKDVWATDISCEITLLDEWIKIYRKGTLIADYVLSETVEQV